MGAVLALAGLPVVAAKCSPRAQLVYVVMALHARDSDSERVQAGLYYGGHALIAGTLSEFPTPTALREIRRAVSELVATGSVALVTRAQPGRHAVYRVSAPVGEPVDKSPPPEVDTGRA